MAILNDFIKNFNFYFKHLPKIGIKDIIEIILISFVIYQLIKWIRRTRAWTLFKGIIVLLIISAFAILFQLNTIVWIFARTINVGIIALIIVFQPELRNALEQLGRRNFFGSFIFTEENKENQKFSQKTIDEVLKAVEEMAEKRTGALIVMEQSVPLGEYERTGIPIDAAVSNHLLMNIFEHNTPLHDGAVIIRENRIAAATCYLPLSENMSLSKELGTRHRAAVGITEVSDSIVIIISEENGKVSLAMSGNLIRNVDREYLKNKLLYNTQKTVVNVNRFKMIWRGRQKHD